MPIRLSPMVVLLVVLTIAMGGCASLPRTPHSKSDQVSAKVEGFVNIRFWGDGYTDKYNAGKQLPMVSPVRTGGITYLALSGGGSGGAFGAGVLAGWTAAGTRPQFDVVSGVSTGALIAPFAFLGTNYDSALVELYTSGIADSLVRPQLITGILGNGLWSSAPLRNLVQRYVTAEMLGRIATEYSKGRRLFVVTTNLDAQRAVIWDMGAIASHGGDQALKLFRNILTASASIPGFFPPVMIDVVANGHHFQEMHSDGGASTQIFTAPETLLVSASPPPPIKPSRVDLFLVINNSINPEFETIKNSTFAVAGRAYATLIKAHTRSAINATYLLTRRTGINFNLTYVDEYVPFSFKDPFNTESMRRLFAIGYAKGRSRNGWHKIPPAATDRM